MNMRNSFIACVNNAMKRDILIRKYMYAQVIRLNNQ